MRERERKGKREKEEAIEEEEKKDDACFSERVKRWIRGGYRGWQKDGQEGRQRVVGR